MKDLVVIIPCYNEENRLDRHAFLDFCQGGFEGKFLFVNDGSTDGTLSVLMAQHEALPEQISYLDVQPNGGKAEAVRQGITQAIADGAEVVGFWDADLATPLEALPEFYATLMSDGALDMVFGSRVRLLGRSIERQAVRHYLGRVGATMASLVLGLPIYDTQCGAKLFKVGKRTEAMFSEPFIANWMFDVELLARYIQVCVEDGKDPVHGIYEQPLLDWHDVAGSKVAPSDFPKAFWELARIGLRYRG